MSERNAWLLLNDMDLSAQCELEFCLGSGHGGQHRNKTSTAVRVRHLPTGITAEDCSDRSQHTNRSRALNKLRMKIALQYRDVPVPLMRPRVAMDHADYPLWCATLLDHLAATNWNPAQASTRLGMSTSGLVKLLFQDNALWLKVNSHREQPLFKP